jgi:hypothetical protein
MQMNSSDLLIDGFDRVAQTAHRVLDGMDVDTLTARVDPDANTIAWLIWHLTRVQDDHLADAFDGDQVWTAQGWAERLGLPFDQAATGYGQSTQEVGAVRASAELLAGYLDATHEQSVKYLQSVSDADLDRIVDTRWDPPVTLAVRLVSVISDGLQHVGQAAYAKGVLERR